MKAKKNQDQIISELFFKKFKRIGFAFSFSLLLRLLIFSFNYFFKLIGILIIWSFR